MPSEKWDEIIDPFPNFNDVHVAVEVWGQMNNLIPHFIIDVIGYPCYD